MQRKARPQFGLGEPKSTGCRGLAVGRARDYLFRPSVRTSSNCCHLQEQTEELRRASSCQLVPQFTGRDCRQDEWQRIDVNPAACPPTIGSRRLGWPTVDGLAPPTNDRGRFAHPAATFQRCDPKRNDDDHGDESIGAEITGCPSITLASQRAIEHSRLNRRRHAEGGISNLDRAHSRHGSERPTFTTFRPAHRLRQPRVSTINRICGTNYG